MFVVRERQDNGSSTYLRLRLSLMGNETWTHALTRALRQRSTAAAIAAKIARPLYVLRAAAMFYTEVIVCL